MKQVFANCSEVLLLEQDETVWGIGGSESDTQGTGIRAWLRIIEKPEGCRDILKICHGRNTRIILTRAGHLYLNGEAKEVADFIDNHDCSAFNQGFEQLDLSTIFSNLIQPGDRVIDLAIPRAGALDDDEKSTKKNSSLVVVTAFGHIYAKGECILETFDQ